MGGNSASDSEETYCTYCDDKQPIKRTVPWQSNFCRVCGNDVED